MCGERSSGGWRIWSTIQGGGISGADVWGVLLSNDILSVRGQSRSEAAMSLVPLAASESSPTFLGWGGLGCWSIPKSPPGSPLTLSRCPSVHPLPEEPKAQVALSLSPRSTLIRKGL